MFDQEIADEDWFKCNDNLRDTVFDMRDSEVRKDEPNIDVQIENLALHADQFDYLERHSFDSKEETK